LGWRTALTAFGKRLNDRQVHIERYGITIFNEDKLQFYLKQMYASNHFDKKKMTEWENKPKAIKNSFNKGMTFFEGLVRDYKVYEHNSGGTAGKHSFESANQATKADCSNKLQQYNKKEFPVNNIKCQEKTHIGQPGHPDSRQEEGPSY
jgi:hypothetical protein